MSKVKRKPAPPFPYSPRYPHPDPADPFAPLKVLRERAESTNALRAKQSEDSLYGNQPYLLTVSPDVLGQGFDVSYPTPQATDYYGSPPPPTRPWNENIAPGYQSDNSSRPARPPRARTRTGRDSKMYFADVDLPSAASKQAEPKYHHRRRSQSVFVLPRGEPEPTAPVETSSSTPTEVSPPPNTIRTLVPTPATQYTYDDRQSHGYLYAQADPALEFQQLRHMHSASSVGAPPPTVHSGSTPPMTPDDSLSLSSASLRERSASHSPRLDLPKLVAPDTVTAETKERNSTSTSGEQGTPSNIHSADFPILSAPAQRERERSASPLSSRRVQPESDPESEVTARRGRRGNTGKHESMPVRFRSSSVDILSSRTLVMREPSEAPRVMVREPSNASDASASAVPTHSSQGAHAADANATAPTAPTIVTFALPKANRSLSHMSLSLTTLPNISQGPAMTPSANASTTTLSVSSDKRQEIDKLTPDYVLRRAVSVPAEHLVADSQKSGLRPATQTHAERQSKYIPVPILQALQAGAPKNKPAPQAESDDEDAPAFTAPTHFIRPLSPAPTDGGSTRTADFPLLHHPPAPPPPVPVPKKFSPIPPRTLLNESVEYYAPPAELEPESAPPPAPLPLCPPNQYSDCPTPLPLPSIPRTRSPSLPEPMLPPLPDPAASFLSEPVPPPPPPRRREREAADDEAAKRQTSYLSVAQLRPQSQVHVEPQVQTQTHVQAHVQIQTHEQPQTIGRVRPAPPARQATIQGVVHPEMRAHTPPVQGPPRAHTPPVQVPHRAHTMDVQGTYRAHTPPVQAPHRAYTDLNQAPHRAHTPPVQMPHRSHTPPTQVPNRTHTPPIQGPHRTHTPPVQAPHGAHTSQIQTPHRARTPPAQIPYRSQSPPPEVQYHSKTSIPPAQYRSHSPQPPRTQSPPPEPPARAQSPPPTQRHHRVQSPQVQAPARAHTEPPRAMSDTHAPSSLGRSSGHHQRSDRQLRSGASTSTMAQSTRRHNTAPSTPIPYSMTTTPSPPPTAYSHPYPPSRTTAPTSVSSYMPNAPRRGDGHQMSSFPVLKFDEYAMPAREQLGQAASLYIIAQNGIRVQFGELFRERKVIVCFIRHFWCAMCQDYMHSLSRKVDPEALKRAGVDLVFIGVGSPAMIKSYRQIFHTPFAMYTDPTLRLHMALGMTRRTTDRGPEAERGEYVRHGVIGGIVMVVRNALRVGMPVWEKGGDVTQLGGEFIFGPGLTCAYTHRMPNTRSHAPIADVLAAAGIRTMVMSSGGSSDSAPYPEDEDAWMDARRRSLARIQTKREKRCEAGERWCPDDLCETPPYSDTGSMVGCWGSSVSKHETDRSPREEVLHDRAREYSEPRRQYSEKTPRRGFVVTNPDLRPYDLPPTPVPEVAGDDERGWESDGAASLAYVEESQAGRTPQMTYWMKQDGPHSFGRS